MSVRQHVPPMVAVWNSASRRRVMAVRWNTGLRLDAAVVAEELAVGPFRLDVAALVEIAFEHPFGVGRHAHVVGHAFDDRQRRGAQRGDQPELVDRQAHRRGEIVDRMRADHEADRQRLAGAALAS